MKLLLIIFISIFLVFCSKKEKPSTDLVTTESTDYKAPTPEPVIKEKVVPKGDASYNSLIGEVTHKRSSEVVWEESSSDTNLFLKDWVKTGEDSSCEISMSKNRIIKMSENSRLILLDKQDKEKVKRAVIGVSKGDVEGKIEGEQGVDSQIVFKLPNAWVKVKSSLKQGVKKIFRISLTSNEMKVHVEEGDVEVLTKGKVLKLTKNKVYEKKVETKFADVDFEKQTEPPAEVVEVIKKPKKIVKKNIIKKFVITTPKNGQVFEQETVSVQGRVPSDQELIFKGKTINITNNKFKFNVSLRMGINTLTFQVIDGQKVNYTTIELERK